MWFWEGGFFQDMSDFLALETKPSYRGEVIMCAISLTMERAVIRRRARPIGTLVYTRKKGRAAKPQAIIEKAEKRPTFLERVWGSMSPGNGGTRTVIRDRKEKREGKPAEGRENRQETDNAPGSIPDKTVPSYHAK